MKITTNIEQMTQTAYYIVRGSKQVSCVTEGRYSEACSKLHRVGSTLREAGSYLYGTYSSLHTACSELHGRHSELHEAYSYLHNICSKLLGTEKRTKSTLI